MRLIKLRGKYVKENFTHPPSSIFYNSFSRL